MNEKLDVLSEVQLKAINIKDGPAMIIAGPGSGKTKVIASRIATLINKHDVDPSHILAMTFTNKAAQEMRERIENLFHLPTAGMWVGTFHGICHRMLRLHFDAAKLPQSFQILVI